MEFSIEQILRSPRFPVYVEELESILAEEQRKRREFYETITEQQKAEFINGEVVVHSPVKFQHDATSGALFQLLRAFVAVHDLGYVGHDKIMVSLTRNDYEPDICFFSKTQSQQFTSDQMHFPAPDFVVEVLSPSTESNDRGVKFEDYAAHGVQEYWLVDPECRRVEQYILQEGSYVLQIKSDSGMVKSMAIPGFEIPIRCIFDAQENVQVLRRMLQVE